MLHIRLSSEKLHQGAIAIGLSKSDLETTEQNVLQAEGILLDVDWQSLLKKANFKAKAGECFTQYNCSTFDRVIFVGLGDANKLREAEALDIGGKLIAYLENSAPKSIHFSVPHVSANVLSSVALGMQLRAWRFNQYKSTKKLHAFPEEVEIYAPNVKDIQPIIDSNSHLAESVLWGRTLANEPGNILYPESYVKRIQEMSSLGLEITVLDKTQMKELGMNALLGVAQGSSFPPYLAIVHWKGGTPGDKPLAFVGKGVTFDSGGISIKPSSRMEDMKADMTGSAVVMSVLRSLAKQKAPVNAVGVVALVENMPSDKAQRPGDIITSMSGQTIEILNTDAEGRLILGDALYYTQKYLNPRLMVDVATLTGAMAFALGPEYAGLFTEENQFVEELCKTGNLTGEKVWHMPLCKAFDQAMDSPVADLQNIAPVGFGAGSSTAAQFLKRFVGKIPWAHLDIANVDMFKKDRTLSTYGASAFGIRLLNRWVRDFYMKS
jgi:leucyl aminopeptidase